MVSDFGGDVGGLLNRTPNRGDARPKAPLDDEACSGP
jgi:hypothetical protein